MVRLLFIFSRFHGIIRTGVRKKALPRRAGKEEDNEKLFPPRPGDPEDLSGSEHRRNCDPVQRRSKLLRAFLDLPSSDLFERAE